jgi:hypothetical protein
MDTDRIAASILEHVARHGPGRTLCPSEVARALAGGPESDWRSWLKPVRATAIRLAEQGRIGIYRKGRPVADPAAVRGVIRLGAPPTP